MTEQFQALGQFFYHSVREIQFRRDNENSLNPAIDPLLKALKHDREIYAQSHPNAPQMKRCDEAIRLLERWTK